MTSELERAHCPVLVVDDDEDIVLPVMRIALERAGYPVFLARDGLEALEIAQREPQIRVVLSDCQMPRMSGHELAWRLHERHHRAVVILITGFSDPVEVDHSVFELLRKPVRPSELVARVDDAAREWARRNAT